MTRKDGRPCVRCGTSEWYKNGTCAPCQRERARRWQAANPENDRERKRRLYWANPEKAREKSRRRDKANPENKAARENRRRTRKTKAGGSYTPADFKALCNQYDNRCACCGKKTKLTADHVIPVSLGGSSDISNLQPLCAPCNSRKKDKTTDYRTKPGILRWIQKRLF